MDNIGTVYMEEKFHWPQALEIHFEALENNADSWERVRVDHEPAGQRRGVRVHSH